MWMKIIILVAVYGIYKIARGIIGNRKHLSEPEILNYKHHRRSLSEPSQRRITNHIGTCEECRKKFTDTLME